MAEKRKWAEDEQIFVTAKNKFSKYPRNAKTDSSIREKQKPAMQEFSGQFWVLDLLELAWVSWGINLINLINRNRTEGRSGQLELNITKLQILATIRRKLYVYKYCDHICWLGSLGSVFLLPFDSFVLSPNLPSGQAEEHLYKESGDGSDDDDKQCDDSEWQLDDDGDGDGDDA